MTTHNHTTTQSQPKPRIALIHALPHSVDPINQALARDWPQAVRMNLLDDSLSTDLATNGRGLDAVMHERFQRLAQYAVDAGCSGILFTCSAFGSCIEAVAKRHAAIPVHKPNEAMIEDAVKLVAGLAGTSQKIGLVSSFAPTLVSMPPEFPTGTQLETRLVAEAMTALNNGDAALHDKLVVEAAASLAASGCSVIALAQFSMARAAPLVAAQTGLPVLTTISSAVSKMKRLLG
jgi:Asp/Glu/Hydantoin racemase